MTEENKNLNNKDISSPKKVGSSVNNEDINNINSKINNTKRNNLSSSMASMGANTVKNATSTNISEPLIKNIKPITNKIISKIIITLTYINILTQNNYFKYYFLFFTLH